MAVQRVLISGLTILLTLTVAQSRALNASSFLPIVSYATGAFNPLSVAVADLNGDGNSDLVVANQCSGSDFCVGGGTVGVLLGNGNGTFQTALTYASGGSFLYAVAVADVNGDGRPDLILANGCPNIGGGSCSGDGAVGVLLGNGDGTFQAAVTYASGGFGGFNSQVAVADVNGDGQPDIVVMNGCSTNCSPSLPPQGSVSILLGTGGGAFSPAASYLSGGFFPFSLAVADLDGDGKLDVVVANWCSDNTVIGNCATQAPIGVLRGNGDGTFQPAITYSSGGAGGRAVVVADVNADGKPDLVTGNCGPNGCGTFNPAGGVIGVLLGNGDGTFQSGVPYGAGSYVSLAVADVDGDNRLDVVAASQSCTGVVDSGCVHVLQGIGDGSFQAPVSIDSGILPLSIAASDLTGDGAADVVVTHEFSNGIGIPPGQVDVLVNNSRPPDTIPPVIVISARPALLSPPNGKLVPVTVSGTMSDAGAGVDPNSASYRVQDEYGRVQPSGAITLGAGGGYSFTVMLEASRRGDDRDGRHYSVTVSVKDNAGNTSSNQRTVSVPHDRGR